MSGAEADIGRPWNGIGSPLEYGASCTLPWLRMRSFARTFYDMLTKNCDGQRLSITRKKRRLRTVTDRKLEQCGTSDQSELSWTETFKDMENATRTDRERRVCTVGVERANLWLGKAPLTRHTYTHAYIPT